MSRVKTFDSTGISPGGVLFAGDMNNIQDHFADLTNLSQNISTGTLAVGEAGLALSRFASGILRISGQLRTDGVINALSGIQVNGSALASTHLSDGVTGTGVLVKANAPAFTASPTAPTPSPGDNSTKLATTAFVVALLASLGGGSSVVPSGAIVAHGGSSAPSGWLLCDGSPVSRSTYSALFAAISTAYGAGDGSTTFNLPNLQGRVPVGKDTGTFPTLGASGGEETHNLILNEIPAHAHSMVGVTAGTPSGTVVAASAGTPAGSISPNPHSHLSFNTTPGVKYSNNNTATAGGAVINDVANLAGSTAPSVGNPSTGTTSLSFVGSPLGTHGHTFTGTPMATHTHTINNSGGGQNHNNLQPYQVVNYIIKT